MLKALVLTPAHEKIYGPLVMDRLRTAVDLLAPPSDSWRDPAWDAALAEVEVIFSGWLGPTLDPAFLARVPRLRAFFYGAGSLRSTVTPAFWEKGLPICSAWGANAVPVAEYTLAQILLGLKRVWYFSRFIRTHGRFPPRELMTAPGAFGTTVALISLGMIGRMVREHLRHFDVQVVAYDPFVDESAMAALGIEKVGLDEAFARGEVVSVHTPWLKETERMIRGRHFSAMRPGATFLNTARGAVVAEEEMLEVLQTRPDLTAILDVTHPEPPDPASALFTTPNVILTPHIAGSMDGECQRMGLYMVEEAERFSRGEPLRWQVTREAFARMA